ncbi:F-box protein [Citrus sinensis]|uniref:F-box protein n=1 Tax=Citrus sinensis TaxID=2711 RepID=A0ACB8JP89_CITSI|nr:F-box protein [Citrus sinensis]
MELLPEGCIANAISFTTPRDACRLSSVSAIFKLAAESDAVWESFLPPDYSTLLSSSSSSSSLRSSSKKELYFSLCHNPILIDEGKKSFSLDKQSGKKCYMISARDLLIIWGDTPTYWSWTSIPEARFVSFTHCFCLFMYYSFLMRKDILAISKNRFPEVAELICVCWLEIRGKINTRSLSPGTLYTAYLVYKLTAGSFGFEYQPVVVSVGLVSGESQTRTVYLEEERGLRQGHHGLLNRSSSQASTPKENDGYFPKERKDEWLEIELGDFFNKEDEDGELEMSVLELACGHWKCGLVIQGIEIRPKLGK